MRSSWCSLAKGMAALAVSLAAGRASADEDLSRVLYYPPSARAEVPGGEACHLKVRLPEGKAKFRTVVWFHGAMRGGCGLAAASRRSW